MAEKEFWGWGKRVFLGGCVCLCVAATGWGGPVRVTVENMAPGDGLRVTPFWVGFHDSRLARFGEGCGGW